MSDPVMVRAKVLVFIGALVLAGGALVGASSPSGVGRDLGLAFISGAVVGAVFVAVEALLSSAADTRNDRSALLLQLSVTEKLDAIDLAGADLRAKYLPNRRWVAARFDHAHLDQAVLFFGNLRHTSLRHVSAVGVDLGGSDLHRADLRDAAFTGADLFDCDLSNTQFDRSILRGADLSHSNAVGASFRDAHLDGATLLNVDLSGADLSGATLDDVDLSAVAFDAATIWPTGLTPPKKPYERYAGWEDSITVEDWLERRRTLRAGETPDVQRPKDHQK